MPGVVVYFVYGDLFLIERVLDVKLKLAFFQKSEQTSSFMIHESSQTDNNTKRRDEYLWES